MTPDHHARGAAAVAVLSTMDAWEANLVLNLRLWCTGPQGQAQVWGEYRRALPGPAARRECHTFETLVRTLTALAHRPLVRHAVGCACVGADESIFVNLIRTAADGHLTDAALIATLLTGPSQAEQIAMLAGEVGSCARKIHSTQAKPTTLDAPNVVRLH
ncbi:MAG: hypothetical protein AAF636_13840 [Pseudomonadota bacterium]